MSLDAETIERIIAMAEQRMAQDAIENTPAWVLDWIERTTRKVEQRTAD